MNNITIIPTRNDWKVESILEIDGRCRKNRYNGIRKIKEFAKSLESPNEVMVCGKDIKLCYEDATITLINYDKNCDRSIYKIIVSKIDKNTPIIEVKSVNKEKLKKKFKKVVNLKNTAAVATALVVASLVFPKIVGAGNDKPIPVTGVEIETQLETDYVEQIEEPEVEFDITPYMNFENRINDFEEIQLEDNIIGSNLNQYAMNKLTNFVDENKEVLNESITKYGVDPYLLMSIAMAESSLSHESTLPGGKNFNGCAYGVMQIENVHLNSYLTAYNNELREDETIYITEDKLINIDSNIQISSMMMQNSLKKYNNNVYIAIQAHNYGEASMDMLISLYAKEIGKTVDEVTSDINDFGWIKYVDDMHENPHKYLSDWQYDTYGSGSKYLNNVLSHYLGKNIVNNIDGNYYIYDLTTNTCQIEKCNQLESKIK
ncbi:MAG: hypothetical protein E7170_02015 [Firmicutes bacterium]|nr:hypothetical protein [Bacillota bacterium]